MIARINILARKKRSEGLTEEEQCEQKALYKEYLGFIRGQVKQQLDKIEIVDELPSQHCSSSVKPSLRFFRAKMLMRAIISLISIT